MVKEDLINAKVPSSLICTPNTKLIKIEEKFAHYEGSYIYWDKQNCNWEQSGKFVAIMHSCCNFGNRLKEHKKAKENHNSSNFYTSYPHSSALGIIHKAQNRYFHDLLPYIGIGFNQSNNEAKNQFLKYQKNVFWSNNFIEKIDKVNFRRCTTRNKTNFNLLVIYVKLGLT